MMRKEDVVITLNVEDGGGSDIKPSSSLKGRLLDVLLAAIRRAKDLVMPSKNTDVSGSLAFTPEGQRGEAIDETYLSLFLSEYENEHKKPPVSLKVVRRREMQAPVMPARTLARLSCQSLSFSEIGKNSPPLQERKQVKLRAQRFSEFGKDAPPLPERKLAKLRAQNLSELDKSASKKPSNLHELKPVAVGAGASHSPRKTVNLSKLDPGQNTASYLPQKPTNLSELDPSENAAPYLPQKPADFIKRMLDKKIESAPAEKHQSVDQKIYVPGRRLSRRRVMEIVAQENVIAKARERKLKISPHAFEGNLDPCVMVKKTKLLSIEVNDGWTVPEICEFRTASEVVNFVEESSEWISEVRVAK